MQFAVTPKIVSYGKKNEGLRPLGERKCVYKHVFRHVKRLFAEATKVRKWMKTARKKLYSLDS